MWVGVPALAVPAVGKCELAGEKPCMWGLDQLVFPTRRNCQTSSRPLAHSVHARVGKRRSEDDVVVPCFSERSRPAPDQAGGRLPHPLAGGDVRHGTPEPPGPAEPADAGTARMEAGLRQPQQQRLIADPQPCGQPRALQRRSPSGYA